jgi:hypothetical protein
LRSDQLRQASSSRLEAPDLARFPWRSRRQGRVTTAAACARSFCRRAFPRRARLRSRELALRSRHVAAERGDRIALAPQLGDERRTRALDVVVVGDVARDARRVAPSRMSRRRSGAPWRYCSRSSRPASASCSARDRAGLLLALAELAQLLLDAAPLAESA